MENLYSPRDNVPGHFVRFFGHIYMTGNLLFLVVFCYMTGNGQHFDLLGVDCGDSEQFSCLTVV